MKIAISYPPIPIGRGTPLLAQNRQFQYFHEPTYIYPMVPAYAATLLDQAGYDVLWDDAIAEERSYDEWLNSLERDSPDMVAIETKTPVVRKHWKIIDDVKKQSPDTKVVLFGDHVTALPRESMENGKVDFVLTGGDYDFLLLNLVGHLEGKETLQPGIWYRDNGEIKSTGEFQLNHDLNGLPFIDRNLTKWWLYSERNGNYKKTPGTYTMVGRDCWWHKCSFCAWTVLYPSFRVRSPQSLVEEVGLLIEKYGMKEVFDDTGTFPVGHWLKKFCYAMIEKGYNKEIYFSCNMRFDTLSLDDYKLMKRAGFRMLLFGLESTCQSTLNEINKNLRAEKIVESCKKAREAGLDPHITIMFGYPWETHEDAERSLDLGRFLLKRGYAETVQATIIIPYPGTPLFEQAERKGWLRTVDWDRYDMREPVLKTSMKSEEVMEMVQEIYKVAFNPEFIVRRIVSIRSLDDVKFALKATKKVLGHLKDFSNSKQDARND